MSLVTSFWLFLRAVPLPRAVIAADNLALRQQLVVLRRSAKRPPLGQRDRVFWVWLSRLRADWQSSRVIVKPATVIRSHREGLRLYWRWKSRKTTGRPPIGAEIRDPIRRMSRDKPTRGAPRIHSCCS